MTKKEVPNRKRYPSSKKGKTEKTVVCYKCGRVGHYANKCKMKQQIQALTIEHEIKGALDKLLLRDTDSEQDEVEINAIDYTSEEESASYEEEQKENTDCDGDRDYYKSLCAMNGLLVLTKEEDLILDLIDNIENPEKKREKLEAYIKMYRDKGGTPQSSIEKKIELKQPQYDLKEILERVKNSKQVKEPTLKELKAELNSVKSEIKELKERITVLEMIKEAQLEPEGKESNDDEENKSINHLHYVNRVERVITHKWHTKVTIVAHQEYIFQTVALIDSGADLNCINEGLVPSRYFSKTVEELNTADGSKMSVKYKLTTTICNQGTCFEIPFLMVKDLSPPSYLRKSFSSHAVSYSENF